MKSPMKPSNIHNRDPLKRYQPIDIRAKVQLRNRSLPLSDKQLSNLKKMKIKLSRKNTEKEAVKIAKRTVTGRNNYIIDAEVTKFRRKRPRGKPKRITKREHTMNQLNYMIFLGSKRAEKELAKL